MSGIPRAGLFSRNFTATLMNRNRALRSAPNDNDNDNTDNTEVPNVGLNADNVPSENATVINESNIHGSNLATANASLESLKIAQDLEGFDDVDSYFNQAVTPKKTPNSRRKSAASLNASTKKSSNAAIVAKPVAMISSKIAEHYRKEPRLAVPLSEAIEALEQDAQEDGSIDFAEHDHADSGLGPEAGLGFNPNHSTDHVEVDDDVLMDRLVEDLLVQPESEDPNHPAITTHYYDDDEGDAGYGPHSELAHSNITNHTDHPNYPQSDSHLDTTTTSTGGASTKRGRRVGGASKSGGLSRRQPNTFTAFSNGSAFDEDGNRRGARVRMAPLRYWANEKVCYGRADDPSINLPVIVQVIKKPDLDDPTFAMGQNRRRGPRKPLDPSAAKLKAQAFGPECDVEALVRSYGGEEEEEVRLLALSSHHVHGEDVRDSAFKIHTIFTEGSYMSAGQLIFPAGAQKPTKNSARHALVFYVISGSFRVEIYSTSFVIGPGGQFHVPRANPYTITHISQDKAVEGRLFFCHCKDNAN